MSLSDKIPEVPKGLVCICGNCELRKLNIKDVKEAVRELKEEIKTWDYKDRPDLAGLILFQDVDFVIDKIFGDKLI